MFFIFDVIDEIVKEDIQLEVLYTLISEKTALQAKILRIDNHCDCGKVSELAQDALYVCFSPKPETAIFIYSLIEKIKSINPKCVVFVVGIFASNSYDCVIRDCKQIDYTILGDYEETIIDVINSHIVNSANTQNCTDLEMHVLNMRRYPKVVDRALIRQDDRINIAVIEAARGCIGRCSFCNMNYIVNNKHIIWRGRNMEDVYHEMLDIYKQYGISVFLINDSAFEVPGHLGKKRVEQLCDLIIAGKYKFSIKCSVRANSFNETDQPLLNKMYKAGIRDVLIGVESVDSNDLEFYNKNITTADIECSMKLLVNANIRVDIGFINFNPMSTVNSLMANFKFLKKYGYYYDYLFFTKLSVEYNTQIHHKLTELNLLKSTYSYLNRTDYKYRDAEVENIENRINIANNLTTYRSYEKKFIEFESIFSNVMSVYDETILSEFRREADPLINDIRSKKYCMLYDVMFTEYFVNDIVNKYDPFLFTAYRELMKVVYKYAKNRKYYAYISKRRAYHENVKV